MGKPAARLTDLHACPMVTPGLPPIPHVGGPIVGPGAPTVLIGGLPAAVVGDNCVCVGPPDAIVMGSTGVMICGKPAARLGDTTAHGGSIVLGCPLVMIGEAGGGGGGGGGGAAGGGGPAAAAGGPGGQAQGNAMGAEATKNEMNKAALKNAAKEGDGLAPRTEKEDLKTQFSLVDEAQKPTSGTIYEIETADGQKHKGKTDSSGKTKNISGVTPADCRITFFNE